MTPSSRAFRRAASTSRSIRRRAAGGLRQSNINNTRSKIAHLVRVLVEVRGEIEERLKNGGERERKMFAAHTKGLMHDVRKLPDFSRFHDAFRSIAGGDMRTAFFMAYDAQSCEYIPLNNSDIAKLLKNGLDLISANFVIPYPPGFPIMVPGEVPTQETIDFLRKLEVKEIHGFEAAKGVKLIRPEKLNGRSTAS